LAHTFTAWSRLEEKLPARYSSSIRRKRKQ
jgi:hypothetical protein